jgi:hypothetical protein
MVDESIRNGRIGKDSFKEQDFGDPLIIVFYVKQPSKLSLDSKKRKIIQKKAHNFRCHELVAFPTKVMTDDEVYDATSRYFGLMRKLGGPVFEKSSYFLKNDSNCEIF